MKRHTDDGLIFSLLTMFFYPVLIVFAIPVQCCFADEYYLLSGEISSTGKQASGKTVTTRSRFVVASAKEVCLSGISTSDGNESFHIAGKKFDRLTVETSLATGEILLGAKSKRQVDHVIEQGSFDPSKPPLYQSQSISFIPFAIYFSSGSTEIEASKVLRGEAPFSNEYGTLSVERDGNKIRSISFEQSAGQLISAQSRIKLEDFRSKLYTRGVKRIGSKVVFDPYLSFQEPALWTANGTVERLPVSLDEVGSRIELFFAVTDFKVGEHFARDYVDSILSIIPDGTRVVRNGTVLYEWRGGKKTAAVDFSALQAGKELSFKERGWSVNLIVTGLLVVVFTLSSLVLAFHKLFK